MFECNLIASSYVTLTTASICNTAAAAVGETFYFEEQENMSSSDDPEDSSINADNENLDGNQSQTNGNHRNVSTKIESFAEMAGLKGHGCSCFGIVVVWLTAIVLHLGITLIGTDAVMFFPDGQPFQVRTGRTYLLYTLWIVTNTFVIALTAIFLIKQRNEQQKLVRRKPALVLFLGIQPSISEFNTNYQNYGIQMNDQHNDEPQVLAAPHNKLRQLWNQPAKRQEIDQRMKTYLLFIFAFALTYSPLFVVLIIDINFRLPPLLLGVLFCMAQMYPIINSLLHVALIKHFIWRPRFDPVIDYYTRLGRRFSDKLRSCKTVMDPMMANAQTTVCNREFSGT
ncbi:hypothetical protein ACOME3_009306 [Neoechinorhynchus agilis]